MRIVSLVPSATEMLFELDLGDEIVGVTHECDYPPLATTLPLITSDALAPDLTSREINQQVRERTERGESIYSLDADLLHELNPDLIVTQALCSVCAVSYDDVVAVAQQISSRPQVVSLDPKTIGEVIGDLRTLAQATDRKDIAVDIVAEVADRIDRVKLATRRADRKPTVLALEWLDPAFVAGHWIPQMIEYAGGVDVAGLTGEPSEQITWEQLEGLEIDTVVVMPCGYDAQRSLEEAEKYREQLLSLQARRVVAVNASSYFSRPSLRLAEGLETLAHILHPELLPESPTPILELEDTNSTR